MKNFKSIILLMASFFIIAEQKIETDNDFFGKGVSIDFAPQVTYETLKLSIKEDTQKILECNFSEIVKKLPINKEFNIWDNYKNGYKAKAKDNSLLISFYKFQDSDKALRYISPNLRASNILALFSRIRSINIGNIIIFQPGDIVFIRNNVFVNLSIRDRVDYDDGDFFNEKLLENNMYYLNLAKRIDELICEENGIEFEKEIDISVFEEEKGDKIYKELFCKFMELEENKRKQGKFCNSYAEMFFDFPFYLKYKELSEEKLKEGPQEEKTVTKIDSPISPKIENSKSKIFIILGISLAIVFGGFLLIYKKRKKKNKIKNNETNN